MTFASDFPSRFVPFPPPRRLSEAVQEIERKNAQPSLQLNRLEEAARRLKMVHDGELASHALSEREVRTLAWALNLGEAPISSGPALQTALRFFEAECGAKTLNGLITSYLSSPEIPTENLASWAAVIRRQLLLYSGRFEELLHWNRHADMIFAIDAPARIGAWSLTRSSLQESLTSLRLPASGALYDRALAGIIRAVAGAADAPDFAKRVDEVMALVDGPDPNPVKRAADLILKAFHRRPHLPHHETLIDVTVRRLGDPRLTSNPKWGDMSQEAREKFQNWLARRELDLFFRAVVMDPVRRAFWLQYVDQMTRSRLILGNGVVRKSDPAIQQFLKAGLHARLDDSDPELAAFIFQIKNHLFVEFNKKPNACYLYSVHSHPIDLELKSYVTSKARSRYRTQSDVLKDQEMAVARILHHEGWEDRAPEMLAGFGIRRETPRYR